jgi:branched-chain amino acid transport system permease protein
MYELINYLVTGTANGFIYSLIAIGFILIFKCSKIFNFAQAEMTILGAYFVYAATAQLKLPFFIGIPVTIAIVLVFALIIERVLLRPLIGQPILAIIILTLALGGFIRASIIFIWGNEWLSFPPLFPAGGIELGKITILSYPHLFFFLVSTLLILSLGIYYRYSRSGLAMRVTADDTIVAKLLGINVTRVLAISWGVASVVGALGGILLTSVTGIHYTAVEIGFKSMTVALVGGLESLAGVIVVGPLMGIIETLVAAYIDPLVGGGLSEVATYFVLMLVLIFRPHGIFGWEVIERI